MPSPYLLNVVIRLRMLPIWRVGAGGDISLLTSGMMLYSQQYSASDCYTFAMSVVA